MNKELSVKSAEQKINLPALPNEFSEDNLNKLFKKVDDEVKSEILEVDTQEGRKRIKELAAKINKSKTAVDTPMRDYLRVLKTQPKALEKLARDSKVKYEKLRESVLEPLTAAQKYQNDELEWLAEIVQICASGNTDSKDLKQIIEQIESFDQSKIWPELKKKFKVAIEAATTSATITLERVEAAEKQAAELEELRRKQDEQEQKERDRQIAAEAEAKAKREAEEKARKEREMAERRAVEAKQREEEAQQAAIKAQRDAELAEERRKQEAIDAEKRAEQAKIDAENRAKEQARLAAESERKRIAEEKAEQERLAKQREADKNHRIKINRAALAVMVANGLSEEDAKTVITLIAKKEVPNISIQY